MFLLRRFRHSKYLRLLVSVSFTGASIFCSPQKRTDFNYAEIVSSTYFNFQDLHNGDLFTDTVKNGSIKNQQGFSLHSSGIDLKYFSLFPKTDFTFFKYSYEENGFSKTAENAIDKIENRRFGISVDAKKIFYENIPVKIKTGNLSYSKSISLLKNPAFSTNQNAIKNSFGKSFGLGAVLPGISSAKNEESTSISFFPENWIFECACFPSSDFLFCAGRNFKFSRHSNFFTGITGGRFFLQPKKETSWFRQTKYFSPAWYDSFVWINNISFPANKIQLSVGVHQNPFENFRFWVRNENRTIIGSFLIESNFFATDRFFCKDLKEGLYSANSSPTPEPVIFQAKLNPQYRNYFENTGINFAFGISAMVEEKKKDLLPEKETTDFFYGTAVQFSFPKTVFLSTFKISHIPYKKSEYAEFEDLKYSSGFELSHSFRSWKASAKNSYSVTEEKKGDKKVQSISFYAYFPNRILSSFSLTAETTKTSAKENKTLQIGTVLKSKKGKIRVSGSVKVIYKW